MWFFHLYVEEGFKVAITTTMAIGAGGLLYLILYFTYGKKLEGSVVKATNKNETPAHEHYDGVDYVPARKPVLFGHHFASIAGAAPIVGPVLAMAWGWIPGLLWVWLGNAFIGAVHDYLSLMASVRYDGRSIQWISGKLMSKRTSLILQLFIYFTLILVIAAFAAVVAGMFAGDPKVATASAIFIGVAIVTGFLMYQTDLNFRLTSVIGVALLIGAIVVGFQFPVLEFGLTTWYGILFVYIIIAASIPVWILLQPRDYLNAYVLFALLAVGGVSFLLVNKGITFPGFTSFAPKVVGAGATPGSGNSSPFWPVIPLVIACGSLSGFHSVVGSGTTSKQLDKELHGLTIGYGGMLTEGFLSTIVITSIGAYGLRAFNAVAANIPSPIDAQALIAGNADVVGSSYASAMYATYGRVGIFAQSYAFGANEALGLPVELGSTFAGLAVAAFALTTLDTTNRLGRYTWSEIMGSVMDKESSTYEFLTNRYVGSIIAAAIGIGLAITGQYSVIWPAFGGANQMLAAIALMTSGLWVANKLRAGSMRYLVLVPAVLLWVTVTSAYLWFIVVVQPAAPVYAIVVIETILALLLMYEFIKALRRGTPEEKPEIEESGPSSGTGEAQTTEPEGKVEEKS